MKVWEATIQILTETGNAAVMWGDLALLYAIAVRAGLKHDDHKFDRRVLNALSRDYGPLAPKQAQLMANEQGRWVRVFRLPEPVKPRDRQ